MRFLFFLSLLVLLQVQRGRGEQVTIELLMPSAPQLKSSFKVEIGGGFVSATFLGLCFGTSLPLARALHKEGIDINEHPVQNVKMLDPKGFPVSWPRANVDFFLAVIYDIYDSMSFEYNKGRLPYSVLEMPSNLGEVDSKISWFAYQGRQKEVAMNVLIASMFILSGISGMAFGLVVMHSRREPAKGPEF